VPEIAFYAAELHEKLSQGDIVRDVPWGLVESPLTICRPKQVGHSAGPSTYGPPDSFKNPAAFKDFESLHLRAKRGKAIVLWHDCQIDKFEEQGKPRSKWFTVIAPVFPLSDFDAKGQEHVRAGRRRAFFYLPESASELMPQEGYVDLRYTIPIRHGLLESARAGTLSAEARLAMYAQFFSFLTRTSIKSGNIVCPHCAQPIPVSQLVGEDPDV